MANLKQVSGTINLSSIALGSLVAMLVLGVFFFQIREQFDSLEIRHMETLKDE